MTSQRVNLNEQKRRDRKRDQRELPIQIQHHHKHAHQRDYIDDDSEQSRRYEILNRFDVVGHARYQIADPRAVIKGKRESLNVMVVGW